MLLETTLMALTADSKKERKAKVLNPPPPFIVSYSKNVKHVLNSMSLGWYSQIIFLYHS